MLLSEDNAQRTHALSTGNDDDTYCEQGQVTSRSENQVKLQDENSTFSWVTLKHFILIVIPAVATLAGISIVWQVWFFTHTRNFTKVALNDDPHEFTVNSFDEYKSLVQRKDVSYIKLVINIENPGDWPTGVVLPFLNQLKHLNVKGYLHGKKLVELVASISLIERLTIDNEGNYVCSETQQMIGTFNTRFKTKTIIQNLALHKFTISCAEMLEYMHTNMKVENLEKISFINGELSEINVEHYENLLLGHKQSLHRIEVLGTSINCPLFRQNNFQFLTKVKRLGLDIHGPPEAVSKTKKNICSMLPNIENLSLGKMLHKWEDLPKYFGCHRLKSFQVSLTLPSSSGHVNLDFLSDAFPYLQSADIMIIYGDSVKESTCKESKSVLGPKKLPDSLLLNTRITSNCGLVFL